MGKKLWRETLHTTVQSSEMPGGIVQSATQELWNRWVKFENFDLERVFSFATLHQCCRKFLYGIFLPILAALHSGPDFLKVIDRI